MTQRPVFCYLSNACPWHDLVCPYRALCLTGEEEEDEGWTALTRFTQRMWVLASLRCADTDNLGWGSTMAVGCPHPLALPSCEPVLRRGAWWLPGQLPARRACLCVFAPRLCLSLVL